MSQICGKNRLAGVLLVATAPSVWLPWYKTVMVAAAATTFIYSRGKNPHVRTDRTNETRASVVFYVAICMHIWEKRFRWIKPL
jgi:hypothetical protein